MVLSDKIINGERKKKRGDNSSDNLGCAIGAAIYQSLSRSNLLTNCHN